MRLIALAVMMVACCIVLSSPCEAADETFEFGGVTYTVTTNTPTGTCLKRTGLDLVTRVDCFDGDIEAHGDTDNGCGDVKDSGLCYSETTPTTGSTTQVDCNNTSYTVTTGDDSGTCQTEGTGSDRSGSCASNEGMNTANADCDNGCGNTSGSGCCCEEGTCGDTCFS